MCKAVECVDEVKDKLENLNIEERMSEADDEECSLSEIKKEIYTIDLDKNLNLVIYGGQDDSATVLDYEKDEIVARFEDFSDSIVFVKILPEERFIVVTLDGNIALLTLEEQIYIAETKEDVSSCYFKNDILAVGTVSGKVFLYNKELDHVNTLAGHDSEVMEIDMNGGKIFSMSNDYLITQDEKTRLICTLKCTFAHTIKQIGGSVMCFARDQKIQIFKEKTKLFEVNLNANIESIEMVNKSLVIGGDFEYILLINTTSHYGMFKLAITEKADLIKKFLENSIMFSTYSGLIGILDIRNEKSIKYFNPNVGTIFDFVFVEKVAFVCGSAGYNSISIEDYVEAT